eukprot:jgi/Mesvir1/8191/Mv12487-RA.1
MASAPEGTTGAAVNGSSAAQPAEVSWPDGIIEVRWTSRSGNTTATAFLCDQCGEMLSAHECILPSRTFLEKAKASHASACTGSECRKHHPGTLMSAGVRCRSQARKGNHTLAVWKCCKMAGVLVSKEAPSESKLSTECRMLPCCKVPPESNSCSIDMAMIVDRLEFHN